MEQQERTLARRLARELTQAELDVVSGNGPLSPEGSSKVTSSAGGEDDCGQD